MAETSARAAAPPSTPAARPPPPGAAADAHLREEALDPRRSFIVQAPAGSGKTELLVQRLLVLLAQAERPEQVLAITFTRKAAAEMRGRLLEALAAAAEAAPNARAEAAPNARAEAAPNARAEAALAAQAEMAAEPKAPEPAAPHEAATRRRARAVVERDAERGWALLENPARLRIQTIDALCAALTRERPVLSGLGDAPTVTEEADPLYRAAARATLAGLERGGLPPKGSARAATTGAEAGADAAESVERLLLHLDGNHARAEELLRAMLARRDQWLRHLAPGADAAALRAGLERELHAAVAESLRALHQALAELATQAGAALGSTQGESTLDGELAAAAAHAVTHLPVPESPLAALRGLAGLPAPAPEALPQWAALAELLTTGQGQWRKQLTKAQGFPTDRSAGDPAALKQAKARAQALLDALSQTPLGTTPEAQALARRLREAAALPAPAYSDAQWTVLEALLALLPRAVAHLRDEFRRAGELDYAEIALGALRALAPAEPNAVPVRDEARHLLVDEFQDTSHGQHRLLESLTAHWPADGSHTVFLVGDPMQSIYRFREAEVGLFLRARRGGLGHLPLTPLTLGVNFRSQQHLVAWFNTVFPAVLPPREDPTLGAVPYAPATAHRAAQDGPAVTVHAWLQEPRTGRAGCDADEAGRLTALIAALRRERPEDSIAVLVRTRGHLTALLPALQQAGLPFQAVEIEALGERTEVRDLLMLARALTHLGDRVAWLAVLRAPWCGLLLADLLHLASGAQGTEGAPEVPASLGDPDATLWSRLHDATVTAGLSADGRQRAARITAALARCLAERERRPLRRWVEGAWLALGGPACVPPAAWPNVEACLRRLEGLAPEREPRDADGFAALLERLFAAPHPDADARLQVMSIHKAKGLQFDTVIVPGLGRVPRSDDAPLLRWFERPQPLGSAARSAAEAGHIAETSPGAGLLLAPIHEAGPERDPVYDFLAALERERAHHETGRLLYVAATRARRALHLSGHVALTDGGVRAPPSRSLLARLWPAVAPAFEAAAFEAASLAAGTADRDEAADADADSASQPPTGGTLRRLVSGWQMPSPPPSVLPGAGEASPMETLEEPHEIEFRWAGEVARHVGTVVHRLLRQIARHGPERRQAGAGALAAPAIEAALAALGVAAGELPGARTRVLNALERTLADERGRWVLAPHPEARSEYALTGWVAGRAAHFVIDRTFVDEDGVRWIVDFKTGSHEGGDPETFLAREQERYRAQLEGYAALLAQAEPGRPIRLALYFPLLQAWRDWPAPRDA